MSIANSANAPTCPCCETVQREQYCSKCLNEGVATHHRMSRAIKAQCVSSTHAADKILGEGSNRGITAWRRVRSEVALAEDRVKRLRRRLDHIEDHLSARGSESPSRGFMSILSELPSILASSSDPFAPRTGVRFRRRQTTAGANAKLDALQRRQREIDHRLEHARKVLVREAISVFGINDQGSSGRWTIAGLPLPDPAELKLQSSLTVNAAVSHVIHLVTLMTQYLSVALPFDPYHTKGPHIGRPILRANSPFLNTTKWRDPVSLWMSSTATRTDVRSRNKHRLFLQAYGLLSHSIAYLSWTQGVTGIGIREHDPDQSSQNNVRIPATSILALLQAMSDSPALGARAHEPGTAALPHMGFSLDVVQVVQSCLDTEVTDLEDQTEDWNLVDAL